MTLSERINALATRIGEEFASLKSNTVTNEGASSSGSVITLTDADDANLLSLTLYGKSTQDGTPSPESPAEITSIADDGDLSVYTAGQNLMPPVVEAGTTTTSSGVTVTVSDDGTTFTVTAPADVSGVTYFTLAQPFTIPEGAYLHIRNTSAISAMAFGFYKKGDWAGRGERMLLPENRIIHLDGLTGKKFDAAYIIIDPNGLGHDAYDLTLQPSVELTSEATDFEAYKGTYADISDIEPLRAVPTTQTEGNYTDADGTKWWADKLIVRSDGSGYIERICTEVTLTEDDKWAVHTYPSSPYYKGFHCSSISADIAYRTRIPGLCNFGPVSDSGSGINATNAVWIGVAANSLWIVNTDFYTDETDTSADDWEETVLNAWLENLAEKGPMKVIFPREESTKEELTSDQVNALLALLTYTDKTHIYNEESADMEVEYVQAGKTSITQILSQSIASTSARGVVELATAEETEQGTDETRAVTPYAGEQVYLKKSGGTVSGDLTVEGTLNADGYVAESAEKLETPVTIQTDLTSTTAASFDGTANATPGVTGILPVANGGTGSTAGAVLLTGAQTVAGTKTFSSYVVTDGGSYRVDMSADEPGTSHTLMYVKPYGYSYTPILRAVEPNGEGYGVVSDFGSRGNSIFGAGEGQESLLSDLATDGSENAYVCADSQVKVVTNANTYDNRGVLNFSSSGDSFYIWHCPRIAEVYKGDTPATDFSTQLRLTDSSQSSAIANTLAMLSLGKSTSRNGAELRAYTDTADATAYSYIGIYAPNGGGTAYTYAPTPASGDSSTKIATTAWVNAAIKAAIAEALGTASSAAVSAVSDTASSETISATSDAVRSAESDDQENE